jgi:serine/threonine-protein kinase
MSDPELKQNDKAPIKELTGRIGKYDIIRPLGKGAMGMVYLAHDTKLERDVALKVMVAQIADDPELKKRFEREAKAVGKMTHPNIVTVFDYDYHTDGSPYIAMELLKGQDLQKAMRSGPMALDRKATVIIQVLAGLAHAHKAGIVHRDIKPANIFINEDGTVKIMDFGVARLTTASMTGTGNIVGTADYMSPEQVKGAHVDGRSDVFSVGCMLYELLAGKRPFHSDNLMAIFYKITHDEPNFDLIPGGAEYDALLPILKKALSKLVEDRYQTAYDFAVDLREYVKNNATSASGAHVLEGLVDLEAPPSSPPQPLTDVEGATVVGEESVPGSATMDLGPTASRGAASTLKGGTGTVRASGAPTVLGSAPTRAGGAARPGTQPPTRIVSRPGAQRAEPQFVPRPATAGASPMLYISLGGLGVLVVALGTYIYIKNSQPVSPLPSSTMASLAPSTTLPPAPTTTAPTPAPPPSTVEAAGRAAATIRSAQSAFKSGDYERALTEAQAALRDDPGNADVRKLLDNALQGKRAVDHFHAAQVALGRGDYAQAASEAEAGRAAAPWDSRGPQLLSQIQDAELRAKSTAQQAEQQKRLAEEQKKQQLVAQQVADLVTKADSAVQQGNYDGAIALYEQALQLDPTNGRAGLGKTQAIGLKASLAVPRGPAGKTFVPGKTTATSTETRAGNVPDGFEDTAGVKVQKGTTAADLPGKIHFEATPAQVKPGDPYTIKIFLLNEGAAPIAIKEVLVTTKVNGRGSTGPVPSLVKDVAPQQRALLINAPDTWKEDTNTWTMEVIVRTTRGETYKNTLTWK